MAKIKERLRLCKIVYQLMSLGIVNHDSSGMLLYFDRLLNMTDDEILAYCGIGPKKLQEINAFRKQLKELLYENV